MSEHRYILEPYKGLSTRHNCPYCGAKKKFVRYIDTETGQHLADHVGKCERANNCGKHYTPKEYFKDNEIFNLPTPNPSPRHITASPKPKTKPVSFIPVELFKQSLQIDKDYLHITESNNFLQFLTKLFSVEIAQQLTSKYFISTSKHWTGANVFWQIDTQGKVRTGKIMLYDPITGKRIKKPYDHITWVHKKINQPEFELKQCFFGEHLLNDKTKPVAIVESEKTAIIASVYLPKFIWLAAGGLESLNPNKCQPLAGRTVALFPDLKGFEKWSEKAQNLESLLPGTKFLVSNLLEKKATEADKIKGFDIADYLIKQDWRKYREQHTPTPQEQTKPPQPIQKVKSENDILLHDATTRNPAFLKLIETFDLVLERIETRPKAETKILSKDELHKLALNTIGHHNHLPKTYIPRLNEMIKHGIIREA